MAIVVGSTLQLVNLTGTIAEVGSYIVENSIGQASILSILQSPNAGSLVAYYYK